MYFLVDFRCHAIVDPWASNNRHTSSTTAPQGPLTIGCSGDSPGRKKPCGQIDGEHGSQTGCCVCFFLEKKSITPKWQNVKSGKRVCQFVFFFFKYNVLDLFSWWFFYGFYHRIHDHAQLTHHLRGIVVCLFFSQQIQAQLMVNCWFWA